MQSGGFLFDPSSCRRGNMLCLGNGDSLFRGTNALMGMEEISKRRSFFGSSDQLFDEDYCDEQMPEKKRRLTPEQVHLLEKSFETENKLEPEKKTQLAKKLGLQPRQVAVWFQNRRARWKTKQLERDYDLLKSSYETLLSDNDSIKKENKKLKSEVASLNEKLLSKDLLSGTTAGIECDALPPQDVMQITVKVEDRLSSGSGVSAVVDEDGPLLLDSGDSFFPPDGYDQCMAAVQSEENNGGNYGGRGYFSEVFSSAEAQNQEEGVSLGWWAWP